MKYDVFVYHTYKINSKKKRVIDDYCNSFKTIEEAAKYIDNMIQNGNPKTFMIYPRFDFNDER